MNTSAPISLDPGSASSHRGRLSVSSSRAVLTGVKLPTSSPGGQRFIHLQKSRRLCAVIKKCTVCFMGHICVDSLDTSLPTVFVEIRTTRSKFYVCGSGVDVADTILHGFASFRRERRGSCVAGHSPT